MPNMDAKQVRSMPSGGLAGRPSRDADQVQAEPFRWWSWKVMMAKAVSTAANRTVPCGISTVPGLGRAGGLTGAGPRWVGKSAARSHSLENDEMVCSMMSAPAAPVLNLPSWLWVSLSRHSGHGVRGQNFSDRQLRRLARRNTERAKIQAETSSAIGNKDEHNPRFDLNFLLFLALNIP